MTRKTKLITIEEWRMLGYYYDINDETKTWTLCGSPRGLAEFARSLDRFALNPRKHAISEHEHLGPYDYLEIMTWETPGIDDHSIHGTPKDLQRLSLLIKDQLTDSNIGHLVRIDQHYVPSTAYVLQLDIKDYGFDPSLCDTQLWDDQ